MNEGIMCSRKIERQARNASKTLTIQSSFLLASLEHNLSRFICELPSQWQKQPLHFTVASQNTKKN